jgi:DNA-binding beta-propeller fold protein YncE
VTDWRFGGRIPLLALLLGMAGCGAGSDGPSNLPLRFVRDVAMPGPAVRFDYQDVDTDARRLYIAHLGANDVDIVNLDTLEPVGTVPGMAEVHGVRLAPDLHRVFATATGTDEVVSIDTGAPRIVGRAGTGRFPDGVGYDPAKHLVAVSNKDDGSESVFDAPTVRPVRTVRLGKEVGNVTHDPSTGAMLAAVRPPDELVAFDPASGTVTGRVPLPGCDGAHGVYVDARARRGFVACERNARLAVVDLGGRREVATEAVGSDPDVLAFDAGLERLYVAAESGVVSVFAVGGPAVRKLGQGRLAARAHTVAVDARTHNVFFPLESVGGHPVLRVMRP